MKIEYLFSSSSLFLHTIHTHTHTQVGFLFTYVAPLVFVVAVALLKEAYDDFQRFLRDREANGEVYEAFIPYTPAEAAAAAASAAAAARSVHGRGGGGGGGACSGTPSGGYTNLRGSTSTVVSGVSGRGSRRGSAVLSRGRWTKVASSEIKVGMVLKLHANQRVPADCVLLRTTEKDGSFIRTDQLDGETDWKLRLPVPFFQDAPSEACAMNLQCGLWTQEPHQQIYEFLGAANILGAPDDDSIPLNLENTLWANCVLATGTALAVAVYTGKETRSALNANPPKTKVGMIDLEVNFQSKLLFVLTMLLSVVMVAFQQFEGQWYVSVFRFSLLFSSIIPISLRVNLDMGKAVYSYFIHVDEKIKGVAVRSSNLPEELGRIGYLFSDKTGTLTKNEMVFKKLFTGSEVPKGWVHTDLPEMSGVLADRSRSGTGNLPEGGAAGGGGIGRLRVNSKMSVHSSVGYSRQGTGGAPAFGSEVGDVHEEGSEGDEDADYDFTRAVSAKQAEDLFAAITTLAVTHNVTPVVDPDTRQKEYQAASPDEVALVKFAESVGLVLQYRDRHSLSLSCLRQVVVLSPSTTSADGTLETHRTDFGHVLASVAPPAVLGADAAVCPYAALSPFQGWYVTEVDGEPYKEEGDAVGGGEEDEEEAEVSAVPLAELLATACADAGGCVGDVRVTLERRVNYEILCEFPFTSESRRMGIILRNMETQAIRFFMKGADAKMQEIITPSPWLEEECTNLAREGLRTLVFASRGMPSQEWEEFSALHKQAMKSRDPKKEIETIRLKIENNLELVGMTGVEDKLQDDVCKTLEHLRKAGIRVWMLTGDKVETAICIARSTRLVAKDGGIFPADCEGARYESLWEREDGRDGWRPGMPMKCVQHAKDFVAAFNRFVEDGSRLGGYTMVIDGQTLRYMMDCEEEFVEAAGKAASVVVARCSPTQKADIVEVMKRNIQNTSKVRTAAIGDGGNDVSMILAAHIGLGIEGKEGMHASLAADYSLVKFSHCLRLLTWHGRNSYKRSARLAQFVIHRGLVISVIQAIFSAIYYFVSVPIYTGWLLVGYSTVYTMVPVFALVLDEDVSEDDVDRFPELYKELHKSRSLSTRTFLQWVCKAIYQGGVIMLTAIYLFEVYFIRIVTITFTALILTELATVWQEMHILPWPFVMAELASLIVYIISFFVLDSLDLEFVENGTFWWKTGLITLLACLPVWLAKIAERLCCEPSYAKLRTTTSQPYLIEVSTRLVSWILTKKNNYFAKDGHPAMNQPLL